MGIWIPNKGAGCLTWFLNIVFAGVGVMILVMALTGPEGAGEGGVFGSKRTEMTVLGVFFIISPVFGHLMVRTIIGRFNRKARLLLERGVKGSARVISMRETGTTMNNAPQVEFELEVTVPGGETYRTLTKDYVSLLELAAMKPGSEVDVLVDPEDPGNLMIWSDPSDDTA
jgi:hypothetical protein